MPDIEVIVFNQKLKLSYKEDEKQKILKAVKILNNNWNKFSHLHGKVSDIKIATLISIELQDSIADIQILKESIKFKEDDNASLKKEIELKGKESEEIKKTIKKLNLELNSKNEELSRFENILDELNSELLDIKNIILNK